MTLLWPSAMKASISSTVRGTHVSSSIPLAVTAMSSSIRTCYREDAVIKVFQLEMRSTSGSDGSGNKRSILVWVVDRTEADHKASSTISPRHRSSTELCRTTSPSGCRLLPPAPAPQRLPSPAVALQVTQVVPLLLRMPQGQAE